MKKIFIFISLVLASGCINMYERCPGTSISIQNTYQATGLAMNLSYVVMFPQVIGSQTGNPSKFYPENIVTVPAGCLCYVDAACEAALDTVLWPVDKLISESR